GRVGVRVAHAKELPAGLGFVLREACAQRFSQRPPEPVQARIEHLENAAYVRRLGTIQEQVRRGCVGVTAVSPLQQSKRNQRVEEIERGSFVELRSTAERVRPSLR